MQCVPKNAEKQMKTLDNFHLSARRDILVQKDLTVLMTLEAEEFTWYPLPGC